MSIYKKESEREKESTEGFWVRDCHELICILGKFLEEFSASKDWRQLRATCLPHSSLQVVCHGESGLARVLK